MIQNDYANLCTRIGLGFFFFWQGFGYIFFGKEPVIAGLLSAATAAPALNISIVVGVVFIIIGAMLALGLFSGIAALVSAVILAVMVSASIYLGVFDSGLFYKDIAMLGASIGVFFIIDNKFSLDYLFE